MKDEAGTVFDVRTWINDEEVVLNYLQAADDEDVVQVSGWTFAASNDEVELVFYGVVDDGQLRAVLDSGWISFRVGLTGDLNWIRLGNPKVTYPLGNTMASSYDTDWNELPGPQYPVLLTSEYVSTAWIDDIDLEQSDYRLDIRRQDDGNGQVRAFFTAEAFVPVSKQTITLSDGSKLTGSDCELVTTQQLCDWLPPDLLKVTKRVIIDPEYLETLDPATPFTGSWTLGTPKSWILSAQIFELPQGMQPWELEGSIYSFSLSASQTIRLEMVSISAS